MIRFAIAVTAVEVALTLAASLWIAYAETGEPYLTEQEFTMLGIPVEKYSTEYRTRFGAPFSYDTQGVVKGPGPAITVSVRVHTPRAEYDNRLSGERWPKLREGDEPPSVLEEAWPSDESGYLARQKGRNGVRAELVRLHGADLLIVRVIRVDEAGARPEPRLAACERLTRVVQEYMMIKLGWRETAPDLTSP